MRIVFELRRHQPPDRFNFGIRNFRGLPFERDEGNGTIRPERLVVTPRRRNINEEIIFEKRLFDDLVPITPPPPDFVCRQERLDEAARKILENLFFVTRSCVQRIPGHSERFCYRWLTGTHFNVGSGPLYSARGRISRLFEYCSRMWAVHPDMRLTAKNG